MWRLFIVFNFAASLSRSFWPNFPSLALVDVNFGTVNFPSVNVRVLKSHNLALIAPQAKIRSLRRGFRRVLHVQLIFAGVPIVYLKVLGRGRMGRIFGCSGFVRKTRWFLHNPVILMKRSFGNRIKPLR